MSKSPLKFCNWHVFEWDMDHWPNKVFYGPIIIWVQNILDLSVTIERMYVNSSNLLITENEWLTIVLYVVDNV